MPVHNASNYLNETLSSLLFQSYDGELELSIFDDASTVSQSKGCLSAALYVFVVCPNRTAQWRL